MSFFYSFQKTKTKTKTLKFSDNCTKDILQRDQKMLSNYIFSSFFSLWNNIRKKSNKCQNMEKAFRRHQINEIWINYIYLVCSCFLWNDIINTIHHTCILSLTRIIKWTPENQPISITMTKSPRCWNMSLQAK